MVNAIIGAMTGAIVGVVAFVVVRGIIEGQDRTHWTAAENAIIEVIPVAIGVLVLIGVFSALQMGGRRAGG